MTSLAASARDVDYSSITNPVFQLDAAGESSPKPQTPRRAREAIGEMATTAASMRAAEENAPRGKEARAGQGAVADRRR